MPIFAKRRDERHPRVSAHSPRCSTKTRCPGGRDSGQPLPAWGRRSPDFGAVKPAIIGSRPSCTESQIPAWSRRAGSRSPPAHRRSDASAASPSAFPPAQASWNADSHWPRTAVAHGVCRVSSPSINCLSLRLERGWWRGLKERSGPTPANWRELPHLSRSRSGLQELLQPLAPSCTSKLMFVWSRTGRGERANCQVGPVTGRRPCPPPRGGFVSTERD
jgi:hypothetical protein